MYLSYVIQCQMKHKCAAQKKLISKVMNVEKLLIVSYIEKGHGFLDNRMFHRSRNIL